MGNIYYIMGKSATGKDTIFKKIVKRLPHLRKIILYTTRPKREREIEGREYHFVTEGELDNLKQDGKVVEYRTYDTAYGPWTYATVDDGDVNLTDNDYIAIGTLESYIKLKDYYKNVVPIYIEVAEHIRRERAFNRELLEEKPKIKEVMRRLDADNVDFSNENLKKAGITKTYKNIRMRECVEEIVKMIANTGSKAGRQVRL